MFVFAVLIGVYSYIIFTLGIAGWLYRDVIFWITILFWGGVILLFRDKLLRFFYGLANVKIWRANKLLLFFAILIALQAGVNFIGVLGPERGFDALWYHLTLPKLYLLNHSVYFIPGGLLYYSAMPKLTEMLFVGGLAFGNETLPKMIHFSFGLLTCLALYKLSRKFFAPLISLIAVVIFYSNLIVAWESITAYVDLTRAFFEVMALWAFVNWISLRERKWFIWSAVMLGLAITTKVLAIGSLVIFSVLISIRILSSRATKESREISQNKGNRWYEIPQLRYALLGMTKVVAIYWIIALAVPLPWFVFSYINTGSPVYPFFTEIYRIAPEPLSLIGFFRETWELFTKSADPISSIYAIILPLGVWLLYRSRNGFGKLTILSLPKDKFGMKSSLWAIGAYSLLAVIVWYFTPRTGGGRFILPYLPALSILCAWTVNKLYNSKMFHVALLKNVLLIIIVCLSIISIGYRFGANAKYLPVIFGLQTKSEFLEKNLNFAFGDFYDIDGYFEKNIQPADTVLLYGFHNLYYVNFSFIDSSWRKPEDDFTYVATQNTNKPEEFNQWVLVYKNDKTMVNLYKLPEKFYSKNESY